MEITIQQITQESQKSLSAIKEGLGKFQNQAIDLMDRGLDAQARQLTADKIAPLLAEQDRILSNHQEESQKIARKRLEGIASGESISDKKEVIRNPYTPAMGSGFGGYSNTAGEYETQSTVNSDKLRKEIAALTGKPINKINVKKGLGVKETTNLEGLGDNEAIFGALKQQYGGKVMPLIVYERNNYLVPSEDGGISLVFPPGMQGSDVVATAVTEVVPMAAGLYAAGATAATGVGIGFSIPAFNTAYAAAKGGQKAVYRAANDVDIRPGQIAGAVAWDASVGTLADYTTLGTAKFIKNRFIEKSVENLVETDLKLGMAQLQKHGLDVNYPFTAASGLRGVDFYNTLAGQFPNSPLGRTVESTRQVLAGFRDKIVKKSKGDVAKIVVQKIDTDVKLLEKIAASSPVRIQNSINNSAKRTFDSIAVEPLDLVRAGETTADIVTKAKKVATDKKNEAFQGFEKIGDEAGASISPDRFRTAIEEIVLKPDLAANPKVNELLLRLENAPIDAQNAQLLRQQMEDMTLRGEAIPSSAKLELKRLEAYSQPFSVKKARELVDEVRQMVPDNLVGKGGVDFISADASKAVDRVLKEEIGRVGLTKEWDEVTRIYGDEFVPFREGALGKVSRDQYGKLQMSPERIIKEVLTDYDSISSTIRAVRNSGDEAGAEQLKQTLQGAYMQELGISNNKAITSTFKEPDPAKMKALFGLRAGYVTKNIDDLKKLAKVDASKISKEDALALTTLMPEIERRKLLKTIVVRDQAIKEEDKIARNLFLKEIKSGNIDILDNEVVIRSMIKARNSDLIEVFKGLPPQIRKDLGTDMLALQFTDFGDTSAKTRLGQALWDADKFNKVVGDWKRGQPNPPEIIDKIDIISGSKELGDLFMAASKNLAASTPTGEPLYQTWRTLAAPSAERGLAFKIYTTLEYPLQWSLATAYGNDLLKPYLRSLSRNISEKSYQRNTDMLIKATVATSAGIKVSAQQARNDPEFAEQLPEIMRLVKEEAMKTAPQR